MSKSRGGSHRVLILTTLANIDDVPKSQKSKRCQNVASALQNVCCISQPRSKEVSDVINNDVQVFNEAQEQAAQPQTELNKGRRGRPPKGQEKEKVIEYFSPKILRSRNK